MILSYSLAFWSEPPDNYMHTPTTNKFIYNLKIYANQLEERLKNLQEII